MNQQTRQSLEELMGMVNLEIPLLGFTINLILAALLAYILYRIYVRFGYSISNRKSFGRNFLIIATTTMLIISIVKSSLALSLGLVGALSIVRFRSAIKEPEELGYLFVCIGIGLGLGANQTLVTLVGFALICTILIARGLVSSHRREETNLYLTIASSSPMQEEGFKNIVALVEANSSGVDLKRWDSSPGAYEMTFQVEFENVDQMNRLSEAIRNYSENITVSFVDNQGLA